MKIQAAIILVVFLMWEADSVSAARGVLPLLVLKNDLAAKLSSAEKSVSSHVISGSRLRSLNPVIIKDLKLDDVFFHLDTYTSVELTEVKLNNVPTVGVKSAKPNLEFLTMGVEASMGSLEVVGSFKVVNKNIMSAIPVITSGEFTLSITDIQASGRVGLTLIGDSYTTINYDVEYEQKTQVLTTRYFDRDGTVVSSSNEKGGKIAEKLDRQLKHLLNEILKENLDVVLSELSMDQMIGDPRLKADYTEHVKQVRAVANGYIDELLGTVQNFVHEQHYEEITIPSIDAGFSKKILFVTWHGEFKAEQGHIRNLASLRRTADISMEYDEATGALSVFGSLGLSELQLGYGYWSAKFMNVGPSGSLSAVVGQNSIFLKLGIVISTHPTISLQDFHIEYAKDIQIQVTGLGILDFLVSTIATWVVGIFNDQIIGSLDGVLNNYVVNMLSSVDPSKYFG